jgi:urease accessory protein
MSVNVFPSEIAVPATLPAAIRAKGRLLLAAERTASHTFARRIAEEGPLRVRFPRLVTGGRCEAILINTAGGIVGGDRLSFEIEAGEGTELSITSQAAEKIYRSSGEAAELSVRLCAERNAKLAWLPQETILFDQARIARRLDAEISKDASVTICEAIVFGRAAMGERVTSGSFSDRWRIRREGKLIFADTLRVEGEIDKILARPAITHGAIAATTILQVAADAERKIEQVRAISIPEVEFGASAFDGLLVVRALAPGGFALRRFILAALDILGAPVPRAFTL